MPEYLAPGVYVEETSFRSKSIEGVGTSTTAFVGPTRKGPVAEVGAPLEMLTSFGDFERLYGGVENLRFGTPPVPALNYLAHAVLNYFNEGGARLYVARVANGAVPAAAAILGNAPGANALFVRARFGGSGGNGTLTLSEIPSPTTEAQLEDYPLGTLLRVTDPAARPATLEGGPLPAKIGGPATNVRLNLTVNGQDLALGIAGRAATTTATADLSDPVVIGATETEFRLRVNGVLQVVQLPVGSAVRADFLTTLNNLLQGASADLDGQRLRLTTSRRGTQARLQILSARLGFQPGTTVESAFDAAANNVGDLGAIGFADLSARVDALNASLPPGTDPVLAISELPGGRFALRTRLATSAAQLTIRPPGAGETSAHPALGLPAPGTAAAGAGVAPALYQFNEVPGGRAWQDPANANPPLPAGLGASRQFHVVSFSAVFEDADGATSVYDDIAFARTHPRFAGNLLTLNPTARADALAQPIWFDIGTALNAGQIYNGLLPAARSRVEEGRRVMTFTLTGGNDGQFPMVGTPTDTGSYAAAFELLRALEDVSIVAAPGHPDYPSGEAIRGALIAHAESPRAYRIAVLDPPRGELPGGVQQFRGRFDSHRAALYYPWVTVANPLARPGRDDVAREIDLPPSGFICGIYARNDVEQGVAKAPANEVVRGALRFEREINFAQNQLLNPLGVNCLRFFPGRGYRVWGARTASSDPEWKYVNVRRYFNYLESSIDRGTQWAVFENNGERLWANVRETISSFLYNEWVSGNLLGSSPKEAFFVRCDRSTMTQNDLDNGRLICLIGVAVLKPAEFVIFRIGQKTADARS